ncbi:MAG: helix-turn-helix domain-containing protein [Alicyclobacillus sp.]|nr:helix-turn-helix domain-containing protein [Alicyclobacillus sp.]
MSIKLWFEETDIAAWRSRREWTAQFVDDADVNVVGRQIRFLRTTHGWTQEELGKRLGFSKVAICSYKHGVRVPSVEVLNKLADVFGVTVDFLLGRSTGDKDGELIEVLRRGDYAVAETEREIIGISRKLPKEKIQMLLEFGRFLLAQSGVSEQVV